MTISFMAMMRMTRFCSIKKDHFKGVAISVLSNLRPYYNQESIIIILVAHDQEDSIVYYVL